MERSLGVEPGVGGEEDPVIKLCSPQRRRERRGSTEGNRDSDLTSAVNETTGAVLKYSGINFEGL
jgi:hypothetical protein